MGKVSFCTCNDYDCPFNPVNHNEGCTPCIAKNLKEREIPSCFFNAQNPDRETDRGNYKWEDFARVVAESSGEDGKQVNM